MRNHNNTLKIQSNQTNDSPNNYQQYNFTIPIKDVTSATVAYAKNDLLNSNKVMKINMPKNNNNNKRVQINQDTPTKYIAHQTGSCFSNETLDTADTRVEYYTTMNNNNIHDNNHNSTNTNPHIFDMQNTSKDTNDGSNPFQDSLNFQKLSLCFYSPQKSKSVKDSRSTRLEEPKENLINYGERIGIHDIDIDLLNPEVNISILELNENEEKIISVQDVSMHNTKDTSIQIKNPPKETDNLDESVSLTTRYIRQLPIQTQSSQYGQEEDQHLATFSSSTISPSNISLDPKPNSMPLLNLNQQQDIPSDINHSPAIRIELFKKVVTPNAIMTNASMSNINNKKEIVSNDNTPKNDYRNYNRYFTNTTSQSPQNIQTPTIKTTNPMKFSDCLSSPKRIFQISPIHHRPPFSRPINQSNKVIKTEESYSLSPNVNNLENNNKSYYFNPKIYVKSNTFASPTTKKIQPIKATKDKEYIESLQLKFKENTEILKETVFRNLSPTTRNFLNKILKNNNDLNTLALSSPANDLIHSRLNKLTPKKSTPILSNNMNIKKCDEISAIKSIDINERKSSMLKTDINPVKDKAKPNNNNAVFTFKNADLPSKSPNKPSQFFANNNGTSNCSGSLTPHPYLHKTGMNDVNAKRTQKNQPKENNKNTLEQQGYSLECKTPVNIQQNTQGHSTFENPPKKPSFKLDSAKSAELILRSNKLASAKGISQLQDGVPEKSEAKNTTKYSQIREAKPYLKTELTIPEDFSEGSKPIPHENPEHLSSNLNTALSSSKTIRNIINNIKPISTSTTMTAHPMSISASQSISCSTTQSMSNSAFQMNLASVVSLQQQQQQKQNIGYINNNNNVNHVKSMNIIENLKNEKNSSHGSNHHHHSNQHYYQQQQQENLQGPLSSILKLDDYNGPINVIHSYMMSKSSIPTHGTNNNK